MPRYTDEQLATALIETKGMAFLAAKRAGCDHVTMNKRIRKSARLQAIIAEQSGQVLDTAELKLYQAITTGELGAIKYFLSTKGKERGYIERQEVTHRGDPEAPIAVITLVPPAPRLLEGDADA